MKKCLCALLSIMLAADCVVLTACGDATGEEISLTVAEGTVYSHGEQTIELTFSSAESGAYTFEEDIAASDVTVSGGLAGKTVTEVARADDSTLRVTLSGTVTGEVGLTDGKLHIRVTDFIRPQGYAYPVVRIAPEVTTFNKELYVYIGRATFGVGSGYDLV